MNREIKFRVWDNCYKLFASNCINQWHEDDLASSTILLDQYGGLVVISKDGSKYSLPEKRYSIQFSTGLKDKNGKEIFEGDIIKERRYDDPSDKEGFDYVGVVRHKSYDTCDAGTKFSGYVTFPNGGENKEYAGNPILDGCEVIGNIFEHPTLLK